MSTQIDVVDALIQDLAGAGRCSFCTNANPQFENHTAAAWTPTWFHS